MENQAFLTLEQCANYLNTSKSTARRLLIKYNIMPIDYGIGRRNGLRWRTSAVIQLSDTLHAEAQSKTAKRRKPPKVVHPVCGKSAAELYMEFNGGM